MFTIDAIDAILVREPDGTVHRMNVFKDGIAYMPVPRCGACKHWNGDTHRVYGICAKVIELDGNLVSNDFGCVQWEAR